MRSTRTYGGIVLVCPAGPVMDLLASNWGVSKKDSGGKHKESENKQESVAKKQ